MAIKITMKEILKRNGWTLEHMADVINCSISQISKIQTGNAFVTKNFQEKFQAKFPEYELVNDKLNWKEKYIKLQEQYDLLYKDSLKMEKELNKLSQVLNEIFTCLIKTGNCCKINADNINHYNISGTYGAYNKTPIRKKN